MLPRRLKDFNVFVEGYSLLGIVQEVALPKLTRKMEEYLAAGMDGPVEIDMGAEKLEIEITSAEFDAHLLRLWGVMDPAGIGLRFRGAMEREGADASVEGVEIVCRGRLREVDMGTPKRGELTTPKYMMALSYYRYTDQGEDIIEIDHLNGILKVDGKDLLADRRAALGV